MIFFQVWYLQDVPNFVIAEQAMYWMDCNFPMDPNAKCVKLITTTFWPSSIFCVNVPMKPLNV